MIITIAMATINKPYDSINSDRTTIILLNIRTLHPMIPMSKTNVNLYKNHFKSLKVYLTKCTLIFTEQ